MPRSKQIKPRQFEKLLTLMVSGNPVTREEIESKLGSTDFQVYRLSSYIYNLKMDGGVVKTIKNGRNVVAYQLMNSNEMKKFLVSRNIEVVETEQPIQKLEDLNATPEKTEEEPVEKPVQKSKVKTKSKKEEVVEVLEVTEEE